MRARNVTMAMVLFAAAVAACKSDGAPKDWDREYAARSYATASQEDPPPPEPEEDGDESGGTGTAMALEEGKMGKKEAERAEGQYKMKRARDDGGFGYGRSGFGPGGGGSGFATVGGIAEPAAPAPADDDGKGGAAGGKNRPEGITRAWFPETFLFEPRIITDDAGAASVKVRVPDRLTTWRVLALAHSRSGAQGAAVTSFLGTLPTYVDLVVPDTLVRGDEVRLPIQLVNTSEKAVTETLTLQAENAQLTGSGGTRTLPAQGALVDYARVVATTPGQITLRAGLGGSDAVVRTIEVLPVGRPELVTRTGTLAAPRTLSIEGPAGADPATGRVRLLAFPGALALLRAELGVCTARQSVADDAYALMLAGNAKGMLAALGDEADPEALRTLSILTAQRAVRHARTLDVETATLLTEAALGHAGNPVVTRLGERAAQYLVRQQKPDGTFAGGSGWTLQRVVVATAMATRAVAADRSSPEAKQRAMAVAIAASGAFERHMPQVQDPYTAAVVLASGAVHGTLADTLKKRVTDALVATADGAKQLTIPPDVVRADGLRPSQVEANAMAVLALEGDPAAAPLLADLGASLLGSYDPVMGWGDGRTNLVALRAVLQLFKAPVPEGVTITLTMDGQPVMSGVLDRGKLREVLALEGPAPALAGAHTWEVKAEPAVPGLGYSLTLEGWVPWEKAHGVDGLELQLPETITGAVGKPTEIALRAVAPSGLDLHIEHSLPAGVQVDTPSLEKLVEAETISRFTVATGKVDLYIDALDPGETFAASYRVIPTLAGKLHSSASIIEGGDTVNHVPPSVWIVK
jgi:hypothetical protein